MPSNAPAGPATRGRLRPNGRLSSLEAFSIATAALLAGPWKGGLWQSGSQKTIARSAKFAAGVGRDRQEGVALTAAPGP